MTQMTLFPYPLHCDICGEDSPNGVYAKVHAEWHIHVEEHLRRKATEIADILMDGTVEPDAYESLLEEAFVRVDKAPWAALEFTEALRIVKCRQLGLLPY